MESIPNPRSASDIKLHRSSLHVDHSERLTLYRTYTDPSLTTQPLEKEFRRGTSPDMTNGRSSPSKKPLPPEPYSPSSIQHSTHIATTSRLDGQGNEIPSYIDSPEQHTIVRRSIGGPPRRPKQLRNDSKAELGNLLDEAEKSLRERDEEIQRLKEENEQLRQAWTAASGNLAATRATISHVLEDRHFISSWQQLGFDIRSWASQHFDKPPPAGSFTRWRKTNWDPSKHIIELTPYWKPYISSDDLRPLLVQAFVWNMLQKHVFAWPSSSPRGHIAAETQKPGGAYWAFDDQHCLASLNAQLKPKIDDMKNLANVSKSEAGFVKDYFDWRVANAVYIQNSYALHKDRNANIRGLAEKITSILSPFTDSINSYAPGVEDRFSVELYRILETAVKLDSDIWLQRAFFHPAKPRYIKNGRDNGERFHPETMELYGNAEPEPMYPNPEVTLVISPCLVKSGNAEGENYDVFTTLVKAQVSCAPISTRYEYPQSSHASTGVVHSPRVKISRTNSAPRDPAPQPGSFDPQLRSGSRPPRSHDMRRPSRGRHPRIEGPQQ
ncbi:hypothetical protein BCR34DRAFT_605586 [Clohesyomyces aquaticus]|uniref:Uncharacterized protein n=1 Tax=Clohesyomyces aquaticus TaxID=1231657 RepID=A0A1Y1YWC7_9PLEO|nr:hypothetical protein BCR34DRAFT_605586 [Clohesyomyces aquaticus]